MNSLHDAIVAATSQLAQAGVASPRVDAELLAAYVLGKERKELLTVEQFPASAERRFWELVRKRCARIPLQHLTGTASFHQLDLAVGPGGFIPRPETELLVEWGLSVMGREPVVVDLCAGTGAIGLAVAHQRPDAIVYAVEAEPDALTWLHRNAERRRAAGDRPITVVAGDATDPHVLAGLDGRVDLVLANPPYVPSGVRVPEEVAKHDPSQAVFAGGDGLAVIRPLVSRAAALLRPGGWFGVEHDDSHGEVVPRLLTEGGWTEVSDHTDLAGRPRYATARRAA